MESSIPVSSCFSFLNLTTRISNSPFISLISCMQQLFRKLLSKLDLKQSERMSDIQKDLLRFVPLEQQIITKYSKYFKGKNVSSCLDVLMRKSNIAKQKISRKFINLPNQEILHQIDKYQEQTNLPIVSIHLKFWQLPSLDEIMELFTQILSPLFAPKRPLRSMVLGKKSHYIYAQTKQSGWILHKLVESSFYKSMQDMIYSCMELQIYPQLLFFQKTRREKRAEPIRRQFQGNLAELAYNLQSVKHSEIQSAGKVEKWIMNTKVKIEQQKIKKQHFIEKSIERLTQQLYKKKQAKQTFIRKIQEIDQNSNEQVREEQEKLSDMVNIQQISKETQKKIQSIQWDQSTPNTMHTSTVPPNKFELSQPKKPNPKKKPEKKLQIPKFKYEKGKSNQSSKKTDLSMSESPSPKKRLNLPAILPIDISKKQFTPKHDFDCGTPLLLGSISENLKTLQIQTDPKISYHLQAFTTTITKSTLTDKQ